MHPAFSVIVFTTLAGAAQGTLVTLSLALLSGAALPPGLIVATLCVTLVMLVIALGASFLHLGHPERAWRAIAMWRSSWLSREVIVLPAFIGVVALWLLLHLAGVSPALRHAVLPIVVIVLAVVLWWCTAMIYACLKFIEEWAHPLTFANYLLIGLASGGMLYAALALLAGAGPHAYAASGWAVALTVVALAVRVVSLVRNARLRPKSTPQSATGLRAERVVQRSMGMSAGAFNTREFMHGRTRAFLARVKMLFIVFGFVVPAALVVVAMLSNEGLWLLFAVPIQYVGLLAERWFFFAQARHPQNIYYQAVS
jgi:DMSO reductase anchor subunit